MKILVFDHDMTSRRSISEFLQNSGHSLWESGNGLEAIEILEQEEIDITILDAVPQNPGGIDICRHIRNKEPRSRPYIILLIPGSHSEEIQKGMDAGADEFIEKPVNFLKFKAHIRAAEKIVSLERMLADKHKELADLREKKNKSIATAAHDLRNPLISIRGFSELLLKEPGCFNEEQKEFLNIIHSTSRNMLAMLNDLLDISLIDSGKLEIAEKAGSLNTLVLERIRINSLQAKQKHIALHTRLEDTPEVLFDIHRMGQAADNLISNAIKFAPFGTNVYLSLEHINDQIIFSVRDEGPGIPLEEQHLLFSEFHRLSIRPTAGETSTGLGLAITKKIMEAHGGAIVYESIEGSGSTFSLVLPARLVARHNTSAAG